MHIQRRVTHVGKGLTSWQRPPPLSPALVTPRCPGPGVTPGTGQHAEGWHLGVGGVCLQESVRAGAPWLPHPLRPLNLDTCYVLRCWHGRLLWACRLSGLMLHHQCCRKQIAIHVIHAISPRPHFFWKLTRTFNNWISRIRVSGFLWNPIIFAIFGEGWLLNISIYRIIYYLCLRSNSQSDYQSRHVSK